MTTYATGDIHGCTDIEKLSPAQWPECDRLEPHDSGRPPRMDRLVGYLDKVDGMLDWNNVTR